MPGFPANRRRLHGAMGSPDRGFTLVELMIVLVILAVILTVVLPGFSSVFLSTRLSGYTNELVSGLYLARGEAVKRNAPVRMCTSSDGLICDDTVPWDRGWILLDQDGNVLKAQAATSNDFYIQETGAVHTLEFDGTGIMSDWTPAAATLPLTFRICRDSPPGHQERTLTVSLVGKTSVQTTTTGSCP